MEKQAVCECGLTISAPEHITDDHIVELLMTHVSNMHPEILQEMGEQRTREFGRSLITRHGWY